MGTVLELQEALNSRRDSMAEQIANQWSRWDIQRTEWLMQCQETRNYVFATDTSTTSNSQLPWKNKTTLPKLCQIRDNLHSNYLSALFPNERWLRWEGKSLDDEAKRQAIQQYMEHKINESDFREVMSRLLYDFIDYGNCFATVEYVEESSGENYFGVAQADYSGPRVVRIAPEDIVFNPVSPSFERAPKIIRSMITVGELHQMAEDQPDNEELARAILARNDLRNLLGRFTREDEKKAVGFAVDGFGSLSEYLQSPVVELLTFYGDYHDIETGEFKRNQKVVILDRMFVVEHKENESWFAQAPIFHCGWRFRPNNLYAMGPLDNLVGMQYRIDHLENIKADVFDLIAYPPIKVKGDVEEFQWGPMEQIYINSDGDVEMMAIQAQALQADTQIAILEQKMEEFAGAPREAMGMRTPGEKTAFEVQQLQNAAGRVFQEKINNFEIQLVEKLLNAMLEISRRNMNVAETVKMFDDETGMTEFMNITPDDLTAKGTVRPIGARHFAEQNQIIQNLVNISNTAIWQQVSPHVSSKRLATMLDHVMNFGRWDIFEPNIAISEQQETQAMMAQAQSTLEEEANTDLTGAAPVEEEI